MLTFHELYFVDGLALGAGYFDLTIHLQILGDLKSSEQREPL